MDGQYLASSSFDGRINVWDLLDGGHKIREYETKGSFGMSVDIVSLIPFALLFAAFFCLHLRKNRNLR